MAGKLDGYNYDHWYQNIIYMCDEQDVTYTLDTEMDIPFVDGGPGTDAGTTCI